MIGSEIEISVMHKSGGFYRWPRPRDQVFYDEEDIIKSNIKPPEMAIGTASRDPVFRFEDL